MTRPPDMITIDGRTWITLLSASVLVGRSKSAIRKWIQKGYLEVHRGPQADYVDGRAVITCEAERRAEALRRAGE